MSALTIRLPNSVHQKIKELAERDQISVNQPKSGSYPVAGSPTAGFGGPMTGAMRSLM
jgi:HicB family